MNGRLGVVLGALIASLAGLLAGCNLSQKVDVPIEGPEITPATPIALDVSNWNGSVDIQVDDTLGAPEVRAWLVESTRLPQAKAVELRSRVWLGADTSIEEGRAVLRVLAEGSDEDRGDVRSNLIIRLPSCHGVLVRNSGGPVRLSGIGGAVQVENGVGGREGGRIEVRTSRPMHEPIALTTTNGAVWLLLGPESSGRFELSTGAGPVEFRCGYGAVTEVSVSPGRHLAVLNGGVNQVYLRSENGAVRALVLKEPESHVLSPR